MDASSFLATNMADYIDRDVLEEGWTNLHINDPMMTCVNPDLICPADFGIMTQQTSGQQPSSSSTNQIFDNVTNIVNQQYDQQLHLQQTSSNDTNYYQDNQVTLYQSANSSSSTPMVIYDQQQQQPLDVSSRHQNQNFNQFNNKQQYSNQNAPIATNKTLKESQFQQQQQQLALQASYHQACKQEQQLQLQVQLQNSLVTSNSPPPVLTRHDEPKFKIQEQLRLHRELSKRRQERIKAKLEIQSATRLSPLKIKGLDGKKLTGRERQIELEKQEAQELQLRDHYLVSIRQLEAKCNKLREILETIVTTSPDYNNQMLIYLETEKLLNDQPTPEKTPCSHSIKMLMPSTSYSNNYIINDSDNDRENDGRTY